MKINNILLDMDGVLGDFLNLSLIKLNKRLNKNYSQVEYVKNFGQFEMEKFYNISQSLFWETIEKDNDFWINIPPFPWAKDLYKELLKISDVTIATSPSLNPLCAAQKLEWLQKHLNIKSNNVMIGSKKYLMARSDTILIDDYPKNIEKFTKAGGKAILIPSSWNTIDLNYGLVMKEINKGLNQNN